MLVGQEIGLMDVLMITAFGMTVSMAAMVLLWWFVVVLSRAVAWKEAGRKPDRAVGQPAEESDVTGAEIAAIIAAVGAETGLCPGQYKITSIASSEEMDGRETAVIVAAICAQSGLRPEDFRVTSINPIL